MALPGLFIEYLVTGSLSLLWVLPLLGIDLNQQQFIALKIAALAPSIYVLGMFIDFLSFTFVTYLPRKNCSYKARIREFIKYKEAYKDDPDSQLKKYYFKIYFGGYPGLIENQNIGVTANRQISILSKDENIFKQVEMRSSRDRIARSTTFNLFLIALFNATLHPTLALYSWILAVIGIPMWVYFEGNSYGYERKAASLVCKTEDGI